MSHSTNDSKSKRGIRNYLKSKLGLSSSRSSTSSQLPLQPTRGTSPSYIETTISEPASVASSVYHPTSVSFASRGAATTSKASGDRGVWVNIVPPETDTGTTQQLSDPDEASLKTSVSGHDTSSYIMLGNDPELEQNKFWVDLESSLEALKSGHNMLPNFVSPIETLLSCLGGLRAIGKNRSDYEDLTKEITALSDSLGQYEGGLSSVPMSDAFSSLIISIEDEARTIRAKLEDSTVGNVDKGNEVTRRYKRIQSLFRLLKINANMSTEIPHQSLVNSRLDRLDPVNEATYDSDLSTEMHRQGCAKGTRVAALTELNEWLNDPASPSIYWIDGMAGTGKTTIAYTFCEQMKNRKLLAASFFCTHESTKCSDVNRIVPTIAYQLAQYSIPFRSVLSDVMGQNPEAGSRNISRQFDQLLVEPLQQVRDALPDRVVVIIDALDECKKTDQLLDLLFRHASDMPLKFLFTSRPETDIYVKMSLNGQAWAAIHLHDIEKSLIKADIKIYLTQQLESMSPSEAEIDQLVERAGMLFVYAANMVRHAHSNQGSVDPRQRLKSLINMAPEEQHALVSPLYMGVVEKALDDEELEEEEAEKVQVVLNTVLLAQEPVSMETIGMLGEFEDLGDVGLALHPLRDVLRYSETTGLVSTLDSTFPNIMFNKEQSKEYFCDPAEHSQRLTRGCFAGMKTQLKFNICELESSFLFDENVDNLQSRIKDKISPPLVYACRYWANHLSLVANVDGVLTALSEFLATQLLFWMEVLNLLRELDIGIAALLKAKQRLEGTSSSPELIALLDDAYIFMRDFATSQISRSTPHIYISSLQLCPRSSMVYQIYSSSVKDLLKPHETVTASRGIAPLDHQTWKFDSGVLSIAHSPDGTRVAVGCEKGTVNICDPREGSVLVGPLSGHTNWVRCVAFSPDGTRVISASSDCTIRMWNALNGSPVPAHFEGHTHPVRSVAFSFDGSRVVSGSWDNTVRLWDAASGHSIMQPLEGHESGVNCVVFQPQSMMVASGANDYTIRLWDLANDTLNNTKVLKGHSKSVMSITFTHDGTRLVSGSVDSTICVWNVSDGALASRFLQDCAQLIYSVAVSPDGLLVASGSTDSTIRVWNIDTGKLVVSPIVGHSRGVRAIAFSPDGTRILSGSHDGSVRAWTLPSKTQPYSSILARGKLNKQSMSPIPRDLNRIWQALQQQKLYDHVPAMVTPFAWLLDGSDRAYIYEHSSPSHTLSTSGPGDNLAQMPDGWTWRSDGWLVDSSSQLLVWVAPSSGLCHLFDHTAHNTSLLSLLSRDEKFIGSRWPGRNTLPEQTKDKKGMKPGFSLSKR